MQNKSVIVAIAYGDVTGDGVIDQVTLTGNKTENSPFIQNLKLVVINGRNKKIATVNLDENSGYNPTLFLGRFTQNKALDVLVRIDSGGSGAFTFDYIYSFDGRNPQMLFSSDIYNKNFTYEIHYIDGYQVEAHCKTNDIKYIINLDWKGSEYLDEIYTPDGKLKKSMEGFVNPLSSLFPVDTNGDGLYELLAFQKIAGLYNADSLGYFENFLHWNGKHFSLLDQYVAILGADVLGK